jgi:hypothetical protein
VLNRIFLAVSAVMLWLRRRSRDDSHGGQDHGGSAPLTDMILRTLAGVAIVWRIGGPAVQRGTT